MSDIPVDPQPGDEEFDPDLDIIDEVEDPEPEPDDGLDPDPDADPEGNEPDPEPRRDRQGRETQSQRLRRRLDTTERELQELRQQVQQPRPAQPAFDQAAAARAEAEKWDRRAMLSPVELVQEVQREAEQRIQHALLMQQVQMQDQIDKQAYEQAATTSPVHRKYLDRVERTLAAERARGNVGANRTAILKYLIGEDAIARGNGAAPAQRRAAARRVAGQAARPTNARGDGARPAGSRNPDAADEALLRGIRAGDM